MDDQILKEALGIVKAQASVRSMTDEEIIIMLEKLSHSLEGIMGYKSSDKNSSYSKYPVANPQFSDSATNAVKENSIICLACGKSFRILTKRHLALHKLTVEEYKEKYGYQRATPLVCKALQRDRKEIMSNMKLWERKRKYVGE
ncbi:MAG: MucR family transcriptional regulator [Desulfovibrionaceae bacterium]